METILVTYNDKTYTVYNPGKLIKDDSDKYLLDQLNKNLPKMGRYRKVYLKTHYDLTEYDYYIIVVLSGDVNKLPKCEFEGCNNPKHFNQLVDIKKEPMFEIGCCKEHTRILTNRISGRRLVEQGISPIFKALAAPKTEETREKHRLAALKQVELGTHPWISKNRGDLDEKIKNSGNKLYKSWTSFMELKDLDGNNLDIFDPEKMKDINYVLTSERDSFKFRGNAEDICIFYVSFLSDETKFKVGATTNLKRRALMPYHGLKYVDPKPIYTSTRLVIADFEYEVKSKFIKRVVLGTETFPISIYQEVMEFVNTKVSFLQNNK